VYSQSFNGKPVNKTIIKRYLAQRSRGTDGFGFYIPEKDRLTHNVREGRILSLLRRDKATEVLFHHRFPTSTANVRSACHPFSTKNYYDHNYVLVHNGVLHNEEELAEKHYKNGIEYVSMQEDGRFNDSEALAHDVAQFIEGKVERISAQGSIAFICIQSDGKGNKTAMYFGRNAGNPLKMKQTKHSLTISSEGDGELVEVNKLYRWDYKTKSLTSTRVVIPEGYSYSNYYGNYRGYGYGYNWDDDGLEDYGVDSRGRPLPVFSSTQTGWDNWGNPIDANGCLVPNGQTTRDYFLQQDERYSDFEQAERSFVKQKVDELMYDCYENPIDALELAEDSLEALKGREKRLETKELEDTITDAEITEYCMLDDEMQLLVRAIEYLKKEVSGQTQIGFQFTRETIDEHNENVIKAIAASTNSN
jgi:hypothetical protein